MTEQRCLNCRFWDEDEQDVGECHRFPPVLTTIGKLVSSQLPRTVANDWCGEYIADDLKAHDEYLSTLKIRKDR